MSTTRKLFLALAVVSGLYFLMVAFPTQVDIAIRGNDVWLTPGFTGNIAVNTGVKGAVDHHWSGSVTLVLTDAAGTAVSTGEAHASTDWDKSIAVKTKLGGGDPGLSIGVPARIPASTPEGTRLTGTLSGKILTPQYAGGGFTDEAMSVDRTIAIHVAGKGEVTDRSTTTSHWPLPSWLMWLLWLPLLGFVLSSERVRIPIARRLNR